MKPHTIPFASLLTLQKGIREKITSEEKVNHWLDHSKANYGNGFVRRVKNTLQNVKLYELLEPNSVNILLQLPQYIVFTLGEVLFFPAGLEFAYTQAPISMKTAVTAVWYFTIATGKILLVIVAPNGLSSLF
ncbi:hypothetical protein BDFB_002217 [Asbolus verrucosus]|uniref:Uncharacterized protein n=1 Tax=Asbolus verrucosus TaxID=1661398 RepID=A0A482VNH7_ASBVE|nr:hypothetical protein BDFB_002217 [Asbolus verrucosus]